VVCAHRWRRTHAKASAKFGDSLAYQADWRIAGQELDSAAYACRVTRETSPRRAGGYAGGCHCVPSRYIPPPACHLYATCARSSDLHDLRFTNSLCSVQRRPPAPEIGLNSDIFGALSSLAFAHDRMRWRSGCRGALLTYPAVDRQTGTDEHGPSDEHAPAGRAR